MFNIAKTVVRGIEDGTTQASFKAVVVKCEMILLWERKASGHI